MKKIYCTLLMGTFALGTLAQSGTNSPYSQFGLGVLSEQPGGPAHGMNGLGIAYREHNQVNYLNPASYAAVDSLTFIFDVGLSGQVTNFKEGGNRLNARTADFEYAVASLRMAPRLGASFGILPYTNVGYNYNVTEAIGTGFTSSYASTYKGSGGLHEVYAGLGWEPFKGVAVGVNGGYLWGGYDRSLSTVYYENGSQSAANALSKYYSADVRSYKLDFGVQLTFSPTKKDQLTVGATYGLGHKIGGDPTCLVVSTNAKTGVADTTSYPSTGKLQLEIPTTFGAGLMWNHSGKLKVGADYQMQKWADVGVPEYAGEGSAATYRTQKGLLNDRQRVTVGMELCPGENSRRYIDRIRYRAGVAYTTPYLKINGQDGPKEYSASIGFGIPIINGWNNRSILNISAQWVRQESKQFITENSFRINIGITFNERWFDKWKVQ